jgi:GNAT superfamily N-acetyltransferase
VSDPAAIQPLRAEHARPVADLHRQAIPTGFISSLGPAFVTELYRAIASCPHGFGFVSIRGERVTGFVAGALHVGSLYRYILLRRGYRLMVPLARFLVRPGTIRRILQTLLYPARVSADLPKPEILSIAVAADERGRGTAVALMDAAVDELRLLPQDRLRTRHHHRQPRRTEPRLHARPPPRQSPTECPPRLTVRFARGTRWHNVAPAGSGRASP